MANTAAYDEIADWYDEWLGNPATAEGDVFYEPTRGLIGDVVGLRICDLACGQGRVARHLANDGAHVVGVDASSEMLAVARRYDTGDIAYIQDSAHTLESLADSDFDGVICNMALMDIPDLSATVRSVQRILRPGGWFVFSTLHPCFNAPRSGELEGVDGRVHRTVSDYFTEGYWRSEQRLGPPGKVGAYHRTLATYVNTVLECGLVIDRLDEVKGRLSSWLEVPAVLIMRCLKR